MQTPSLQTRTSLHDDLTARAAWLREQPKLIDALPYELDEQAFFYLAVAWHPAFWWNEREIGELKHAFSMVSFAQVGDDAVICETYKPTGVCDKIHVLGYEPYRLDMPTSNSNTRIGLSIRCAYMPEPNAYVKGEAICEALSESLRLQGYLQSIGICATYAPSEQGGWCMLDLSPRTSLMVPANIGKLTLKS